MATLSPLDPQRLDALLADSGAAWEPVHCLATVDSTQDELRRAYLARPPEADAPWRLTLADEQTAGRGRTGARWVAPSQAGILMTIGGSLPLPSEAWPRASLSAGLALVETIAATCGVAVSLKWPNDLLVRSGRDRAWRKLGGVLCERLSFERDRAAWLCGIGVNVSAGDAWPAALAGSAASLEDVMGTPVDRTALVAAIAIGLRREIARFVAAGGWPDIERLHRHLAFLGRAVELDLGRGGTTWAILDGIDRSGLPRLRFLRRDGTPGAAEVLHPVAIVAAESEPAWRAPPRVD